MSLQYTAAWQPLQRGADPPRAARSEWQDMQLSWVCDAKNMELTASSVSNEKGMIFTMSRSSTRMASAVSEVEVKEEMR